MIHLTDKNTKVEILKAYQDLQTEHIELTNKLKSTEKALEKAAESGLKEKSQSPETKSNAVSIQKSTATDNIEGIIHTLEEINKGLANATGNISMQLTIEAENLSLILQEKQKAIQSLKQMYELNAEENQVDHIIEEYESLSEQFEKEYEQIKNRNEEEMNYLSQNWQKEQSSNEETFKERKENDKQIQLRENEQYEYELIHQRNLEEDLYVQKTKNMLLELKETETRKLEEWAKREDEMDEKEKELDFYKTKFEEIPTRLEKEIKKAEAEGRFMIEKEAKVKMDLLSKEVESKKQIYEIRLQSFANKISNQENQIINLSKQLENALNQVQELAVKAIEGSSKNESYDALREMVIEQAKNQQKN